MIHKIKFIIVLSVILFIFIIFFIGLNKSNIYTPSKIDNVELPRFESKELFSGIEIDSQNIIENSDSNNFLINGGLVKEDLSDLNSFDNISGFVGANYFFCKGIYDSVLVTYDKRM